MKFSMGTLPDGLSDDSVVSGNVYKAKGGRGDTKFWLIVSVRGLYCYCLGLNTSGEVVSASGYGCHAFHDREVVGFCPEISEINFNIQWRL